MSLGAGGFHFRSTRCASFRGCFHAYGPRCAQIPQHSRGACIAAPCTLKPRTKVQAMAHSGDTLFGASSSVRVAASWRTPDSKGSSVPAPSLAVRAHEAANPHTIASCPEAPISWMWCVRRGQSTARGRTSIAPALTVASVPEEGRTFRASSQAQ